MRRQSSRAAAVFPSPACPQRVCEVLGLVGAVPRKDCRLSRPRHAPSAPREFHPLGSYPGPRLALKKKFMDLTQEVGVSAVVDSFLSSCQPSQAPSLSFVCLGSPPHTHSFCKYLLKTCSVSGPVLGTGAAAGTRVAQILPY